MCSLVHHLIAIEDDKSFAKHNMDSLKSPVQKLSSRRTSFTTSTDKDKKRTARNVAQRRKEEKKIAGCYIGEVRGAMCNYEEAVGDFDL